MTTRSELLALAVIVAEAAEAGKVAEDMLIAAAGGLDDRTGNQWQMFRWRLEKLTRDLLVTDAGNVADQRRRTTEAVDVFIRLARSVGEAAVPAGADVVSPLIRLPTDLGSWPERLRRDQRRNTAASLHNEVHQLRGDLQRAGVQLKLVTMRVDDAQSP